ncbi:MAG: PIG-L family deacetylase [Vicinamibacteria bacterium]
MRIWRRALLFCLIFVVPVPAGAEEAPYDRGTVGLGLALRRLGVTARVLYVTAHPDDENNAVLVRLARGEGVRTALLTETRGEGGQNAIGPELFDALGVLRSEELAAIHRYDGAEQYFGRAYEFGFSFSVEESYEKWGREETLGDIVRVVRAFRPDVMLTLPLEAPGGGQHHQAVARLAKEAFRAAADPQRFPDQIAAGLSPWQARAIYRGGTGGGDDPKDPAPAISVATGVFDPLLGATWSEVGGLARRAHRSQNMGAGPGRPDQPPFRYVLLDSEPALAAPTELLSGVDRGFEGLERLAPTAFAHPQFRPTLARLVAAEQEAQAAFDARDPGRVAPAAARALKEIEALVASAQARSDPAAEALTDRLQDEARDVAEVLTLAAGVQVEARSTDDAVVPGQRFQVEVTVRNDGREPVALDEIALRVPDRWSASAPAAAGNVIAAGSAVRRTFDVVVADDAPASRPYWRRAPDRDRHLVDRPADETLPWSPPELAARVRFTAHAATVTSEKPALFVGARGPGVEKRRAPIVVPALSVRVQPGVAVVPLGPKASARSFRVAVTDHSAGGGRATVRLKAPDGWTVEPAARDLEFRFEGDSATAGFAVRPPANARPGPVTLRAEAERAGHVYAESADVVSYEHIQDRPLVSPAQASLVGLDVRVDPRATVGYVMGSGDGVADALGQLGVPVTLLDADALASGDLSRFTTIVTGIRAFEVRPDLRAGFARLLDYARAGGHLVVQYNRAAFNQIGPRPTPAETEAKSPFAPYAAAVSPRRVTDETAPLHLLVPGHPLFRTPNAIGPRDFEGWVQERAIQLLDARDPQYRELVSATDPFPKNPGEQKGLLVEAPVGRGTWTYVGLVLFRQVSAGTPGAYRLLANLVSRPRG